MLAGPSMKQAIQTPEHRNGGVAASMDSCFRAASGVASMALRSEAERPLQGEGLESDSHPLPDIPVGAE